MKEKYVIIALFLVFVLSIGASNAADISRLQDNDNWYLNFNSAQLKPHNKSVENNNDGYNFSASLGYSPYFADKFLNNTRIETEISFGNHSVSLGGIESKASTVSIMENAFYDFGSRNNIYPYVGAGAGVRKMSIVGIENLSSKGAGAYTIPTYQAMAGVSYQSEAYPGAGIHVGYKYSANDLDPTLSTNIESTAKNSFSHNIEASIKVLF